MEEELRIGRGARNPVSNDAFVDYMIAHIEMSHESFNRMAVRSDNVVVVYLTTASATLGALVLILAAVQPAQYLVLAALGAAGVVLGLLGIVASLSYTHTQETGCYWTASESAAQVLSRD